MKYAISLVCLSIMLMGCSTAEPTLDGSKIDAIVQDAIAKHVTPSACVVIGTADKVLFAKAYGHFTYEESSPPATLDTMYDMASCSKAVGTTSAAVLLIQDGKLSLDDKVSKHLPDWNRDDKRDVTIRNLMAHTSGLPSYVNAGKVEEGRRPGESKPDALIRAIAELPLAYTTNEGYRYACLNFITLARVNEEVAGVCQETFLRRRLFAPLGMRNSGYYLSDAKKALAAPTIGGEHFRRGTVHDPLANYYETGYRCSGNAGLFTTANDLIPFSQTILSNGRWGGRQIFTPETNDLFATNQVPETVDSIHGVGWGISTRPPSATPLNKGPKNACISHNGYTGTYIHFDRLAGTFLVVLTNRVYPDDSASDYSIRRAILWIMLESDPIYKGILESIRPQPRGQ